MQSSSPCTNCDGSGKVLSNRPDGSDSSGMIQSEETVSIKIPAGVGWDAIKKLPVKEMKLQEMVFQVI